METREQKQIRRQLDEVQGGTAEQIRLQKRITDIQFHFKQDREKAKPTRNQLIVKDTAPYMKEYDFWCKNCQIDFRAPCYRYIVHLSNDVYASWRAICPECDTQCVRHITDRLHDPYYDHSRYILRQRNIYMKDVLKDGQYGFRTLYGDPYEAFTKRKMEDELRLFEDVSGMGYKHLGRKEREEARAREELKQERLYGKG